jgi:pyruvate-ferredoxin/flavodoxin oxidoreductase
MGDGFAAEFSRGKKNLWGETIQFLEPESEHSSASACEGYALAGGRVANFTAGQGLILMKEVLYVIAGKRLPVVFHVGARALTSQSLNIHCGHDDVMGVADCGWGMLFARNAQEVADLALIARRAAEESETPIFVVQDGFLTTHTLESLRLPEPELMRDFVGNPHERLRNLFDPSHPVQSGVVQNQDSYMKGKIAQRYFYERVAPALENAQREFAAQTGRKYGRVIPYRMEDAEYALVGMGSMMETAEAAVDWLRAHGVAAGALSVTSFRPFPGREIVDWLERCEAVCVFERLDVPLAESNPLAAEVKSALSDAFIGLGPNAMGRIPRVHSAVAGLGGRDIRPGHFIAAVNEMQKRNARPFFALGIHHPDAIEMKEDPDVRPTGSYSLRGHSIGGYGSVTTNKILATVCSELFGLHAQAFSKYGSEKKGLPTTYYLTLAPEHVRLHAELNTVNFVAIQDANAFAAGNPLEGLLPGGTVYWQTGIAPEQVWAQLPPLARKIIRQRRIRLYVLDAFGIARDVARRPELQVRMQGIALLGSFLKLTEFRGRAGLADDKLFAELKNKLAKQFGKRGEQVVEDNLKAARRGYEEVREVVPPARESFESQPAALHAIPEERFENGVIPSDFCQHVVTGYAQGREAELEADEFLARSLMPPATASMRSFRHLALEIPAFEAAKCVGCMDCVNECPDTAILAKVIEPDTLELLLNKIERSDLCDALQICFAKTNKYSELFERRGEKGGLFGIFVDPDKCKGCGECITACASHGALRMVPKSTVDLAHFDAAMDLYRHMPDTPARFISEKSLGDMMLAERSLAFVGGAGSCMGCGEATAVRQMLAATAFVYGQDKIGIVAATGCNTVFGSTYPFNPYKVPWTNSLFENAPADAMGIRLRWNQEGHTDRKLWVLGGDGAMLDIGFQSLSRLLMSGMDIKVLVLDTQVYSNTGGQSSTATFTGQDAKMSAYGTAQHGKRERRKELAQIAMMHPDVFVAQTTPAHINHFYKSIMAANEFPGPAVVVCYASCMPEHGVADDHGMIQAKLAVESRTFPLMIYDPRQGERIRERLSLRGNPAMKDDWYMDPKTSEPVNFVTFARTEGRFARNIAPDGQPDEFLFKAQRDRLQNWRMLQELAGISTAAS